MANGGGRTPGKWDDMVLSKEEMELLEPGTSWKRKLAIRLRMLARFTGGTLMIFIATCLIMIAAIIVFFAMPEIMYAILQ